MKHKMDEKDMTKKEWSKIWKNEIECLSVMLQSSFRTSSHESISESDDANEEMGEDDECSLHWFFFPYAFWLTLILLWSRTNLWFGVIFTFWWIDVIIVVLNKLMWVTKWRNYFSFGTKYKYANCINSFLFN